MLFFVVYFVAFLFIYNIKGGVGVLHHHNGKLSQALLDLFPEVGLIKSKFRFLKGIASSFPYQTLSHIYLSLKSHVV